MKQGRWLKKKKERKEHRNNRARNRNILNWAVLSFRDTLNINFSRKKNERQKKKTLKMSKTNQAKPQVIHHHNEEEKTDKS